MKLSQLLRRRQTLLRRATLANFAFAYQILSNFSRRFVRARLTGHLCLKPAHPNADRYWASLTSASNNQSVIEEHFDAEDLSDLADAIAFATGREFSELAFQVEEFRETFLTPLREALENAGVVIDSAKSCATENSPKDVA